MLTGPHLPDPQICPVCDGPLMPERRFPGRAGHGPLPLGERRDVMLPSPLPPDSPRLIS